MLSACAASQRQISEIIVGLEAITLIISRGRRFPRVWMYVEVCLYVYACAHKVNETKVSGEEHPSNDGHKLRSYP